MNRMTREHRDAVYQPANLQVVYNPVARKVDLTLTLGAGVGLMSVSEGGQAHLPHPPSRSPLDVPFWPPDQDKRPCRASDR
jgi:hypothetical protein